jgi:hypothetical protein
MTIAVGVAKKVSYKKQSGLGVAASGAGAQYLRRVTSTIDLKKATYQSNEIRPDQQVADFRHGVRSVDGTLAGELSPGSYADFFASLLRQSFQTPATTGALTNVTSAVTSGASGTFTRAAGSYLTDGFKIGDVIQITGYASPATANNAHNFWITALTATVMTGTMIDTVPVVAKAAGDSVTIAVKGKKSWVPLTGQVYDYYTVEHWFSDIAQSEVFTDSVITQGQVKMPATGMNTVDFPILGRNMTTGTSEMFTTPAAALGFGVTAAANGGLLIASNAVSLITALDFSIDGQYSMPGGVVGSNIEPDVFKGTVKVMGNATVYFQDATFRDYFLNETELSIASVFTTSNLPNADFIAFTMSRVKFLGATKTDGDKGLSMTMPFTALLNTNGGAALANLATTISVQDSTL